MQNIHDEFTIFNIAKESLTKKFLAAVQNKDIPILERLELWEEYADKILPVSNWYSKTPDWLIDAYDGWIERYQDIPFTDLLEHLPVGSVTFDADTDEIVEITPKAIEMLEEVFNTGFCGANYDW